MFICLPFFILKAVPNPNSTEISFEPNHKDCLNLLLSIPRRIIKTVEDIPRVEQFLNKGIIIKVLHIDLELVYYLMYLIYLNI